MKLDKDIDFNFNDKEVAEEFNTHVREQLPWYESVKKLIVFIARSYVNKNGLIYDIGCSTGNIARSLESIITKRNIRLIGIDESKEMLELYPKIGETYCSDALTFDYEEEYDVALLFLVGMFLDSNKRKDFFEKLYMKRKKNGILIIVDKFAQEGGYFSSIMNRFNLLLKVENQVEPKDILNKELSLTGVQIPLNYEEMPGKPVEFFRLGDFRGYVIDK
jgi:tRNA (cmo5U34)-methyltransferase